MFALPDMLSADPTLFKPIPFFMLQKDNLDKSFNLQLTPPACSRAFVRVFIRVCKFARACAYSHLWHAHILVCVCEYVCVPKLECRHGFVGKCICNFV